MTPRTRTGRPRALLVGGALASALALAGCSALGDPSVAALVDGEVVATEAEVATVVAEIPPVVTGGPPLDPVEVVAVLAFTDTVTGLAREYGVTQGPVEAQAALDQLTARAAADAGAEAVPGTYSDVTLEAISTQLMASQLQQDPEASAALGEGLSDLRTRLEINPRYGEVAPEDSEAYLQPVQHPWLAVPEG